MTKTWPVYRLGELACFRNGVNFNKTSFGKGIKIIGVSDFQNNIQPNYSTLDQINPNGIITDDSILKNGDIVFVRSNGNRELIGRSMLVDGLCESVTHSAFTIRLRFLSQKTYPKFYAYFFKSHIIRQALSAHGNGTNISNLNQDILSSLEILLPPLDEQQRIAGILSAYDELIENCQKRIRILEEMARSLYREWFVNFRFPGHESARFVDSPFGRIPEGWEVKTVSDTFKVCGGGTPSRKQPEYWANGTIQWYSPSDLTGAETVFMDDSSDHITNSGLENSSAHLFPAYCVMLTSRATIGAIAINTKPACTNQGFIVGTPNEQVPLYYLYEWMLDNVETFQRMASGATFKEISRGVFKTIQLIVPTSDVVRVFDNNVISVFNSILKSQRQIANLKMTRDLLLHRLLSGNKIENNNA